MRVLHVSSGNLYGGIETMLATVARHRAECPVMDPEFAVCFEGRSSAELRGLGVPVYVLGAVRASRPASVWRARRALAALLRGGEYDAVVCHAPWPHAVFAPVVKALDIPLVFWVHGQLTGRHWIERWARLTAPDLAICSSWHTAETLPRLFARARCAVVYCPVSPPLPADLVDRDRVRGELGTPRDAVVVTSVSRMEPWKGHRLLLEALGRVRDDRGWQCWLVGGAQRPHEEAYVEELHELAQALGIADRVRFCGQRSDARRLLAAADVYCQPNTSPEPFGISFVEAMYAGLPVVTTAIGAAPELVDTSCGVLAPPGDAAGLSAVLGALIADPTTRGRLAAAAPARAQRLCAPATRLAELYAAVARTTSVSTHSAHVPAVAPAAGT